MKKTIVIVGHPCLEKSVVNKYWINAITGKASIRILEEACPLDKAIDVSEEHAILEQYDRIILQFPLYWYATPAIMQRWLEAVLTFGWAYGPDGNHMEGREIGVAVSCGGKETEFSEGGIQLYSLDTYLKTFEATATFVRAKWMGYHSIFDTFNPLIKENLISNSEKYIQFIQK